MALASVLLLPACVDKPPAPQPPSREAVLGAVVVAVSVDAMRRAELRPLPTNTQAASQLGRDAAVMRVASQCSRGAVGLSATHARLDLAAEFDRLRRENPPLFNVAEIELLAESRRQASSGRALPQLCGDALTRMQQIMARRTYLVQPEQFQRPQPVAPRPQA